MRAINMTTKEDQLIISKYDLLFESRLTRVETTLDNVNRSIVNLDNKLDKGLSEMRTDFKWMFGLWVSFILVMLGLMFKMFH